MTSPLTKLSMEAGRASPRNSFLIARYATRSSRRVMVCVSLTMSPTCMPAASSIAMICVHASRAWVSKSVGKLPSAARPGVPEEYSQRCRFSVRTASLYLPSLQATPTSISLFLSLFTWTFCLTLCSVALWVHGFKAISPSAEVFAE